MIWCVFICVLGTPQVLRTPLGTPKTAKSNCSTPSQHVVVTATTATSSSQPLAEDLLTLVDLAKEVLLRDDSLVEIEGPVKICGDVHGQIADLNAMEEIGGQVRH